MTLLTAGKFEKLRSGERRLMNKIGKATSWCNGLTSMASTIAPLNNVFVAIHLVLARQLMVTHFDMDLNPTVPIRELKTELASQLGLEVSQQRWYHRNKLLIDDHSLERQGVIHDSIIEVKPLTVASRMATSAASPAELSAEALRTETSREV